MAHQNPDDLFYTTVLTLSAETHAWLSEHILQLISEAHKRVATSRSERVAILHLDLFGV